MGEVQGTFFEPEFNRSVKVELGDERVTSDSGVLLLREIDHVLGLTESLADNLFDPRNQDKIRYQLVELLRERSYAMAMGYSAQDDLDRLAHDPAMRMAVWNRPGDSVLEERLASQPTHSRLIDILANNRDNLNALREALFDWNHRHLRSTGGDHAVMHATIDVDSFPIQVHGDQQGARHNKHYGDKVYHPLVASFSVDGDYDSAHSGNRLGNGFIHAVLRQGQVHTSKGCLRFMKNTLRKARDLGRCIDFRLDAGFTSGEVLDYLTDEKVRFCGRLKTNAVLERMAARHLCRPVGRPPAEGYEKLIELEYQAERWKHSQRVVLVVMDRPDPKTGQLNLAPKHFFIVTNRSKQERSAEDVVAHYRQRGTFEDRIGEFQGAIGVHLSSQEFADNEATFLMAMLAYNLSSQLRIELEDELGSCWDLSRFQKTVLKVGGRVVKHSRRLFLRVAKSVSSLWDRAIFRIRRLRLPARWRKLQGPRRASWTAPPAHSYLCEVLRH
jgi:hypothetical protein